MNTISTDFKPDSSRATQLDELMRLRLSESLRYLHDVAGDQLDITEAMLKAGVQCITSQPVLADCFAAYYELVYAIDNEEFELATNLFKDALTPAPCGKLEFIPFLGADNDVRSCRYLRPVDSDPEQPLAILPVEPGDFKRTCSLINQSYALLKECDRPLHDEIDHLLRSVVIGAGSTDKEAMTFDGASAFETWGSIVINAVEAKDIVDMVQTLAHESCHNMLFGFCIDDYLVLNPDSERYPSPLRIDPRPIDGIYHATFVLARMFYASTVICEKSSLSPELIQKAENARRGFATRFYDGLDTLDKHARYTKAGSNLIKSASVYMDTHARKLLN